MPRRQPFIAALWLVSDPRNDAQLAQTLARMPRGSGLVVRHYHLPAPARHALFAVLKRIARRRGIAVVLAGTVRQARAWGADGAYGSAGKLADGPAGLRLVTAHSLQEIAAARRARADAIVLSPVFATRSHPGAATLGGLRFRLLAARAGLPVIALGGMTKARARRLGGVKWAAIDGICGAINRPAAKDS